MSALTLERIAAAREERLSTAVRKSSRRDAERDSTTLWLAAIAAVTVIAALLAAASAGAQPRDAAMVTGYGRFALFTALTCGAIWLWWRDRLQTTVFAALIGIVTVVDLWIVDRNFFETVPPPDVTFAADDVVTFLRGQGEHDRVWVLPFPAAYRGHGNYLMLHGIEQAGGEHGNQLQRYNEYVGAGTEVYTDWHNFMEEPNFLHAGNIRFIISMAELGTPFLREVHRGSALIYENVDALPRTYLVDEVISAPDSAAALEIFRSELFDPARTAVVYDAPDLRLGSAPVAGSAEIVERTPDRVTVRATADRETLLVLADNYYDGWQATVNGEARPILRTNHAFRGVVIGAGNQEVVFEYRPADLYTGFYIYLAALVLLAGYGAWLFATKRRREQST